MFRLYKEGNYIVVINEEKQEYFYGHAKEVFVDKNNTNSEIYTIENIKDLPKGFNLKIGEILDKTGVAYTLSEWEAFYTNETGFSTATGGSVVGVAITQEDYDALSTEEQEDTTKIYLISG